MVSLSNPIKLASVATDIMGVSARSMLQAIVGGEEDSDVLSTLARGRMREKRLELSWAFAGRVTDHHRFMLAEQLALPALEGQALLAEVGLALKRFPASGHLASWAGLCPGNNESAGPSV